jgi:hypothetical protein
MGLQGDRARKRNIVMVRVFRRSLIASIALTTACVASPLGRAGNDHAAATPARAIPFPEAFLGGWTVSSTHDSLHADGRVESVETTVIADQPIRFRFARGEQEGSATCGVDLVKGEWFRTQQHASDGLERDAVSVKSVLDAAGDGATGADCKVDVKVRDVARADENGQIVVEPKNFFHIAIDDLGIDIDAQVASLATVDDAAKETLFVLGHSKADDEGVTAETMALHFFRDAAQEVVDMRPPPGAMERVPVVDAVPNAPADGDTASGSDTAPATP